MIYSNPMFSYESSQVLFPIRLICPYYMIPSAFCQFKYNKEEKTLNASYCDIKYTVKIPDDEINNSLIDKYPLLIYRKPRTRRINEPNYEFSNCVEVNGKNYLESYCFKFYENNIEVEELINNTTTSYYRYCEQIDYDVNIFIAIFSIENIEKRIYINKENNIITFYHNEYELSFTK
jgi:hypothetical protein